MGFLPIKKHIGFVKGLSGNKFFILDIGIYEIIKHHILLKIPISRQPLTITLVIRCNIRYFFMIVQQIPVLHGQQLPTGQRRKFRAYHIEFL